MIRRILLWTAVTLAALLLITLLTVVWGIGTGSGTRALWNAASSAVPGLQVASVEGRLAGPLTIRDLRYEDEYRQLSIGSLELDWKPGRLFGAELQLERLHVVGVDFTQIKPAPPPEEEPPFEIPESIDLPVDLVLQDISLQSLSFRGSPDAEPLLVDRAELAATFRQRDLSLDRLKASGPLFSIQAVAQAVTRADYPADATVDWQVSPPGLTPAVGRLAIEGGLQEMRIQHSVVEPYGLEQTATLRDLAGELRFDMETLINGLRLSQIGESMPDFSLEGKVSATGTAREIAFQGTLAADSPSLGSYSLSTSGGFEEQLLTLSELLLTGAGGMRLQAGGEVDLSTGAPRLELLSQWQALRWPLTGEPQLVGDAGRASIRGTLEDYAVQVNSQLEVPGQTGGELAVTGSGTGQSFELSRLRLTLLNGRLDGTGRVRWVPDVEGSIELTGEGLDPSVLLPQMPGDLQLELRARGGVKNDVPSAQIDTVAVTGSFRDRPLDLQLQGQLEGSRMELENLELTAGATRFLAQGLLGDTMDLDWRLDSPDLSDLLPEAAGTISGEGRIGGNPGLPAVRALLQGRDIRYAQYSLAALSLNADVDLDRPTPSNLELTASEGVLGAITVNRLELSGDGTRSAHALQMSTETSEGHAHLQIDGDLQDALWAIQVSEGQLRYGELEPWTLSTPHRGRIALDEQQLQEGCWTSGQARLCLQGERAADKLAAVVDLKALSLEYLRPLLPANIALHGDIAAHATLEQRGDAEPVVDAGIDAEGVELLTSEATGQPDTRLLALQPSRLMLDYGPSGLHANVSMPFVGEGGISGEAQVDPGSASLNERPLRGGLALDLRDLAFLAALSPEIERAVGALSGKVDLAGSLGEPLPEGELRLENAELQLVTPGLDIRNIILQARTTGPAALEFEGGARSGEGELTLSGTAQLDGPQTRADIAIDGEAFQVVDTPDARVMVSPDLAIAVRDTGVRISGEVVVPQAEITPRKLPESAVSASGDQVILTGEQDNAQATASSGVEADIRITLGDDVTVDGFGFKGRLDGGLVVKQVPGRPGTGTGELNIIDGEYRAYGQGLVIEQGKILFAGGPLDQPGISVRAVRRPAAGILVGIRARGPAQAPELEVFSEPGMSQTEQLSWLVLGRPLENTSDGEGDMLAQAATMLGLKGGNFLADKLGGDLGVDTIGFETGSGEAGAASDVDQAAFVIGKFLSPDLYVSYGIGLFESVSTIKLEYSLDENWKLSTESSTYSSGGDVIYTIER